MTSDKFAYRPYAVCTDSTASGFSECRALTAATILTGWGLNPGHKPP